MDSLHSLRHLRVASICLLYFSHMNRVEKVYNWGICRYTRQKYNKFAMVLPARAGEPQRFVDAVGTYNAWKVRPDVIARLAAH